MSLPARFLILSIFLLSGHTLWAFDQFETFAENGKYGLINRDTKEIVLPPEYEKVGWSKGEFIVHNGTIGVRRNGKWALASVEGSQITQHLFTLLYPFTDGLLIAGERKHSSILNKYGIVSTKGKILVAFDYDQLEVADDQLIASNLKQGSYQYGLLSKSGKTIIPQEYESIDLVEEGIYAVRNTTGLAAIFNKTGKQLSEFEFEAIEAFDDKRLLIRYYNRQGLVNKNGKAIIPPVYKEVKLENGKLRALPFQKWSLWVNGKSNRSFFFDKTYPLGNQSFAVQTNENVGIVNREEVYLNYLTNLQITETFHGLGIVSNGQFRGAINEQGKLVLPLTYDEIKVMPQVVFGRIKRQDGQDWQAFTHKGNVLSQQHYESLEALSNGMIKAGRNGKMGLLDAKGNERTPFIYDSIGVFKNDRVVVKYQGNQGVINTSGYWAITPYKDSLAIHEDYILYKYGSENGLLDFREKLLFKTQERIIPAGPSVAITQGLNGFSLRNLNGEQLLQESYDSIQYIHNDLFGLKKAQEFWLYKPSVQSLAKTPSSTMALGTYAEDAVMALIDDQWGFLGEQGELKIANRYQEVAPFSEGLAAVKLIGKWGVINRQEQIIIQPVYDEIRQFYGGLALVKAGKSYGMINRTGDLVLNVQYDELELFDSHILIKTAGLVGLADRKGSIIRTPQYDQVTALGQGRFLVKRQGKLGVINLRGQDRVPTAFETVIPLDDGAFLAAEPSNWISPVRLKK